jgi:hypothetical protein
MIDKILNDQFKDLISEETFKTIEEAFNQAVEDKSKEKIALETENIKQQLSESHKREITELTEKIDSDHTNKLKKLVEAIDTDHAVKLQKLVTGIDKKHTALLKLVNEKHNEELSTKAKEFHNTLVEEISNYIDLYIDKALPKEQLTEAVANIEAATKLKQIRQIIGVTDEFIDSEIKEALVDGKTTIDSLRKELNQTLKENVELQVRANKAEAKILLESKTNDMPSPKKTFINRLLGNKSPDYIEENFNYVVEMFEKQTQEELETVKEDVKQDFIKTTIVDRPEMLEEKANFDNEIERNTTSGEGVSGYLNEMKKISGNKYTR